MSIVISILNTCGYIIILFNSKQGFTNQSRPEIMHQPPFLRLCFATLTWTWATITLIFTWRGRTKRWWNRVTDIWLPSCILNIVWDGKSILHLLCRRSTCKRPLRGREQITHSLGWGASYSEESGGQPGLIPVSLELDLVMISYCNWVYYIDAFRLLLLRFLRQNLISHVRTSACWG